MFFLFFFFFHNPHPHLPLFSPPSLEINVDYCSGQSLPNCRGWAKYKVAPSSGTPGGTPITLQQATGQWALNLFASGHYEAASEAGRRAASSLSSGGQAPPALPSAGTVTQWVDTFQYPMNPSCYYPPG